MNEELIKVANEIKDLLAPKECPDVARLNYLYEKWKHCPAIKDLFSKDYDRRALNPGFGAPNCYCHLHPPCQNCVDFTNTMSEEELENHLKNLSK